MGFLFILSFILSLSLFVLAADAIQEIICPFKYIYQFGDSCSDTGNGIRISGPTLPAAHLPYGETFPGKPTGRWSDGRLIIDYAAMAFGLPLLNPFMDTNASFNSGVNFAVGGSTALDYSFFAEKGLGDKLDPNISCLSVQIQWFFTKYIPTICFTPTECDNTLRRSLIFMGTFGGNDINLPLCNGKSFEDVETNYVPFINQAIVNATRKLIMAGALRIVVPGNFPTGCMPLVLNELQINDTSAYDSFGCLIRANNLAIRQNKDLQGALDSLRREFPNVVIFYADYYNAFLSLLQKAPGLGFHSTNLLKVCCGGGIYDAPDFCGNTNAAVCSDPNRYIIWDGIHLTQKAYSLMADIIIADLKAVLQVSSLRTYS